MKTRSASLFAIIAATLAFHAPAVQAQTAGAIIGGLTGGLLCNQVGNGTGHVVAVATCAVAGSQVGTYVQNGLYGQYNQMPAYDPAAAERQRRMQWEQEQRAAAMARQRQMEQERRMYEQQMRNQQHGYYSHPNNGYQHAQYPQQPVAYQAAPVAAQTPHTTVVIIEREVIYRDREPAPRKYK